MPVSVLPALTSLTHMFIAFKPRKTPYPDVELPPLILEEAWAVETTIQKYLPLFGQACGSLQWVAFDVYDLDLQWWEISREGMSDSEEGEGGSSC